MELRLLKYFFAVTEELHFTRAAERLGISQPTLSQQIRNLEAELNTVLFHRNGKAVEITDTGYILLRHVNRIMFEIDRATTTIDSLNNITHGDIRIGCSGNRLLFSPLLNFHREFPNVQISIFDLKTEKTIEKLLNSTIDIGVVFLPVYHEQLEFINLFSAEFYAITSKSNIQKLQQVVDFKYLSKYPLFFMPEQYYIRQVIDQYCLQRGIKVKPTVESSDSLALIQMAALNNGFTILPKFYMNSINMDKISVLKIKENLPSLSVGVIFRKGMYISPIIKSFIDHIKEAYVN